MYLKQIEQLVMLQQIDGEMIALKAELENAPLAIRGLEEKSAEIERAREQVREKLGYLNDQFSRLENEMEEDHVKLKKSKSKMMMVGNSKEYHAMVREMDNIEKLNRSRDEEKLAINEELERQNKSETELVEQSQVVDAELAEARTGLAARMDAAEKRLAELSTQRKTACTVLPKPILARYEFIRSRLPNPVIVSVDNGICSGCNISIPPQAYIELQKGQQILSCPNCQRLIYWVQHIQVQQQIAQEEAAALEARQEA